MNGNLLLWTLLVLLPPFVSFAWNGLVIPWRRAGKPAAYLSIVAILTSLVASLVVVKLVLADPGPHTWQAVWMPLKHAPSITVGLYLDPLAAIMLAVVALVASMVQIYSLGYMSEEPPGSLGRYFTYHSLFAFSMLNLVAAGTLIQIYAFWELVGLCSYLLIGFWYYKPSAANAAVKAFWTTKFGDVGFAIGLVLLWAFGGSYFLPDLFHKAASGEIQAAVLSLSMLLVFFGAMGKSAQFPLHIWLPDAMEGPTPVSALIHAATMVAAGVYLVSRVFPIYTHTPEVMLFIAYIGSFTAFFAATIALVQEDIKRVLAYSTISQLGYMMAALGAGSLMAGYFHMFTHAFFKALLFLGAGSVIHAMHTNDIWKMGRLFGKMKHTALVFLIGTLALAGIPPFAGYYSKDEIVVKLFESGLTIPFLFALVTVFLTAFYMFRVIFVVFFGNKEPEGHPHESPPVMTVPMWILAILSIVAGFLFKGTFEHFFGAAAGHGAEAAEAAAHAGGHSPVALVSLVLAFAGIFFAWLIYQKEAVSHERLRNALKPLYIMLRKKYWLDDIAYFLYRRVLVDGLAVIIGWFDRYIVDGIVNFVTWLTQQSGILLRSLQNGKVQDYLYGVVLGILLILLLGAL